MCRCGISHGIGHGVTDGITHGIDVALSLWVTSAELALIHKEQRPQPGIRFAPAQSCSLLLEFFFLNSFLFGSNGNWVSLAENWDANARDTTKVCLDHGRECTHSSGLASQHQHSGHTNQPAKNTANSRILAFAQTILVILERLGRPARALAPDLCVHSD